MVRHATLPVEGGSGGARALRTGGVTTTHDVLRSQYLSALAMLGQAVERCPDDLWTAGRAPFWRVAYHALLYAHLYLQPTEADFMPWERHRADAEVLAARLPYPPFREVAPVEPYARADVLAYLEHCRAEVARRVPALDLDAPSGFAWLPFGKLELQLYNIRHVQQHAGELADRLGARGIEIDWVGMGSG